MLSNCDLFVARCSAPPWRWPFSPFGRLGKGRGFTVIHTILLVALVTVALLWSA